MKSPYSTSAYIGQDVLNDIKASIDIVDVISDYISLKEQSGLYVARCPFHTENTASFKVSRRRGFFYCFGKCHKSGDAITFIQEIEGCTFSEAVKTLASKYNIEVFPDSGTVPVEYYQNNKLAEINKSALKLFKSFISTTELEYLYKRFIDDKTIESFDIGYAKDSWDSLLSTLSTKYKESELLECGLIKKSSSSNKVYDFFRGRIVIPIKDVRGTVLGFTARDITGNSSAKYINSSDNALYSKRKTLFGIFQAKESIIRAKSAILAEGAIDVVSLYKNGIRNAVASLGTAFTKEQCSLLGKFTSTIVICYDGDESGIESAIKAGKVITEYGLECKVLFLPNNLDPDEYINKYGAVEFNKLYDSAKRFLDFIIEYYKSRFNIKIPEEKSKAVSSALECVSLIEDSIAKREYFEKVMDSYSVDQSLYKILWESIVSDIGDEQESLKPELNITEIEIILYKLSLEDKLTPSIRDSIPDKLRYIIKLAESKNKTDILDLIANEELRSFLYNLYLSSDPINISEEECIIQLEKTGLLYKLNQVKKKIAEEENDDKVIELINEQENITSKLLSYPTLT